MIRKPAVSGTFYDSDPGTLRSVVQGFMKEEPKAPALGVIVPHAGYLYSGAVAGNVYSRIEPPEAYVILSPNHTGYGTVGSIMCAGGWETPLGVMTIDEELARSVLKGSDLLKEDTKAHLQEHSIEVQLPFMQFLGEAKFVPITLMGINYQSCTELAWAVAEAVRSTERSTLIVASSDMTHFESAGAAKHKDGLALERVRALDPEGLYDVVQNNRISMCGFIPSAIMLLAAKSLGGRRATVVQYATSGDVSGDYDQVVGYAGVIVA